MVVHDQRSSAPDGFVQQGAAASDQIMKLRIALHQTNIAGLEDALMAVSTPGNALYGQHLTKEEVEAFVAPPPDTVSLVNQWLSNNDIFAKTVSPAGDWLEFSIPINKANSLIAANFQVFQHPETGKEFVRTLSYSIPEALLGHIDVVHPTTTFDNPFVHLPFVSNPNAPVQKPEDEFEIESRADLATCATAVTPACLEALYGIPTTAGTQSTNVLGVSGFIDQFANQADLATFLKAQRPDVSSTTTFSLEVLDGGVNTQSAGSAGIEANLDVQYTVGIATKVPNVFISVGDNFQDGALEGFLDIINFLLAQTNPPSVLTTSYGQNENTISRSLANSLCNAYMQLGARGTSILFASGDGGVSGSQSASCKTFVPTFPSGCPFMTSVGATTGNPTETAATFSSGGFSNFFGRPSYQSAAVSSYLTALATTNSGKFNTSGRAFPDVSAQGQNVQIVVGGKTEAVAGTSCSSPIFASVIALLNDELIASGKSRLGFLNPFLYSAAGQAALNDITTGDNPGCNTNGFPAKAGWDPVTGLGTPNFAKLRTAVGL
ncbi:family S53 protease [Crassisporium funariophilum]|nr:family S53 protease [Crassisporium funariophilum]